MSSCCMCAAQTAALPAGQCGTSEAEAACRSTTATSGTLEIFSLPCKDSTKWSSYYGAQHVVNTCQTVKFLGGASSLPVVGGCSGVADGFSYINIR